MIEYQDENQYTEYKNEDYDYIYEAGGHNSRELTIEFKNVNLNTPKLSKYTKEIDIL